MFDENSTVFAWQIHQSYNPKISSMNGPHYIQWQEDIGSKNFWHTLEDLLKIGSLSASTKKRLKSCKPGTFIDVHYLHSNGRVFLQRLSKDEIKEINSFLENKTRLKEVNEAIKEASIELHKEKSKLTGRVNNFNKKYFAK